MADESTNKMISSTDPGFPGYLNFDKLRSESIEYLGRLSGKIWTDHNVHDPGITILEVLIYAILDLGYRTNLPAVDLFTRDPADSSTENNFFTPARVLANNPLTITDYRKLLVDIKGVKNAWLEVEDRMPAAFCRPRDLPPAGNTGGNRAAEPCGCDFLNGLYHVYVELEEEYGLADPAQAVAHNAILSRVRSTLMSHRNLCEDFVDIKVLCRLKIGLCGDIELDPAANPETVYLEMLTTLRDFFSPAPKFYTLPQLLEKGRPIEEIFAGRPYDLAESHGFVDTAEFEEMTLRRTIRLSDVYHRLFAVAGIRNIRNLSWKTCQATNPAAEITDWELHLPENFIASFESACSGFQFYKYGMKLAPDLSKTEAIFAMNFSASGKVLYSHPSPYLDAAIPQGVYRSDLADYYSIQHELPSVYGIGKGGLPANASSERKAQALQLKGFLLFFDQLLANYLTQLKNIRSLFSLSGSGAENGDHTYFTSVLSNIPGLDKLLRFNTGSDGEGALGSNGTVLVFPTDRKTLEELIATGNITGTDLERRCNDPDKDDFPPYRFCNAAVRDQEENLLRDDLLNGDYEPVIVSNRQDCYFFYYFTSSTRFALVSRRYYKDEREARTAAASIKYLGTFAENYRSFMTEDCVSGDDFFSFNIELNLDSYAKYLQLIAEDESRYISRRQDFLNHLLSRFAETFSDYALISAGFLTPVQLQRSQVAAEEKFLSNYDDLSSNRGRAYDYLCNGWNNDNTSGFEKRFKALSGIRDWKKHSLCNFVVEKADEIYQLSFTLFETEFTLRDKMMTYQGGSSSLNSVFEKLATAPGFETEFFAHENKWSVFIKDQAGNKYSAQRLFDDQQQAVLYAAALASLLSEKPDFEKNVFISVHVYKIFLKANNGEVLGESITKFTDPDEAGKYFKKVAGRLATYLDDPEAFSKNKKELKSVDLVAVDPKNKAGFYIDRAAFQFKPVDVIQLDLVKKKFALVNDQHTVQFDSTVIYDTLKLAEAGFKNLLAALAVFDNYSIQPGNQGNEFRIEVSSGGQLLAVFYETFTEQSFAEDKLATIFTDIARHTYQLVISDPIPDQWEFKYLLADPLGERIEFVSRSNYKTAAKALEDAKSFYEDASGLRLQQDDEGVQIVSNRKRKITAGRPAHPGERSDQFSMASRLLHSHQDLAGILAGGAQKKIEERLAAGRQGDADEYIYKLVDKDRVQAAVPFSFLTLAAALSAKNELVNIAGSGYNPTGISFGWDIIHERKKAATGTSLYHYLVQCNNIFYTTGSSAGQLLVLFESVTGFATREAAMVAFQEEYLPVLGKARVTANYGPGRPISLVEITRQEETCAEGDSMVFVPVETIYEFGGNPAGVVEEVRLLARAYPIIYIKKGKYKFSLFNREKQRVDWRSVSSYGTAEEAMQQFRFFMQLLNYPGNIFIDETTSDCQYHIYIREVLAISARTFFTPAEAWGITGVERFICIAQSDHGFHNYLNNHHCSHSFFVACNQTGLIHPCVYETPGKRDDALNRLYKAASFNFFQLLELDEENNLVVKDPGNNPFAYFYFQRDNANHVDLCEQLVEIFEAILVNENYIRLEEDFYLANPSKLRIAAPVDPALGLEKWKDALVQLACYFPLYRSNPAGGDDLSNRRACNYYVQVKLPGFDACQETKGTSNTGYNPERECDPGCFVAWKSDCCFQSCCEALQFYAGAYRLMGNFEHYKTVYECDCGYYGIEMHANDVARGGINAREAIADLPAILRWLCSGNGVDGPTGQVNPANACSSDIIAFSPQRYENDQLACQAVERAKKLVNSEGLHLVEHILLRPHCQNSDGFFEDCNCPYFPQPCQPGLHNDNETDNCHFPWKPGGSNDACEEDDKTCFTPGCDPFSFIATLTLPAWPLRFRSRENRAVIENLLQKEVPAHILLRILWLKPEDLCCFEFQFRNWNAMLAKKACDIQNIQCDFLGLLFNKNFESLDGCEECKPCDCNASPPVSCFADERVQCEDFNLTATINQLYCWNSNEYEGGSCNEADGRTDPVPVGKKHRTPGLPAVRKVIKAAGTQDTHWEEDELPATARRERSRRIQSRSFAWKKNAEEIAAAVPNNPVAENALRFLADVHPDPKRYEDLVNKILKNKADKARGIKALSLKQKQSLIENISWQYFDRICLGESSAEKIVMHRALFNHLRKNRIDMESLYDGWKSGDIRALEPGIDFDQVKVVVT